MRHWNVLGWIAFTMAALGCFTFIVTGESSIDAIAYTALALVCWVRDDMERGKR